jgi:hypothetical protein
MKAKRDTPKFKKAKAEYDKKYGIIKKLRRLNEKLRVQKRK